MKTVPNPWRGPWVLMPGLLAGCGTLSAGAPVDPAAYAAMDCNELNRAVGEVSQEISQTAITRGRVARFNIPTWAPGGQHVAAAVVDRQTARIESLQERERAITATRNRNCPRG
jgi:hypothetical protein